MNNRLFAVESPVCKGKNVVTSISLSGMQSPIFYDRERLMLNLYNVTFPFSVHGTPLVYQQKLG